MWISKLIILKMYSGIVLRCTERPEITDLNTPLDAHTVMLAMLWKTNCIHQQLLHLLSDIIFVRYKHVREGRRETLRWFKKEICRVIKITWCGLKSPKLAACDTGDIYISCHHFHHCPDTVLESLSWSVSRALLSISGNGLYSEREEKSHRGTIYIIVK